MEPTIEYIAGWFDGEGCILAAPQKTGPPTIRISAVNTYKPVLDALAARWGGHVGDQPTYRNHHKRRWQWQLNGREKCRRFLMDIEPYLWEKREQARVALEALDATGSPGRRPGGRMTQEEVDTRWACYRRLRELKHHARSAKNGGCPQNRAVG